MTASANLRPSSKSFVEWLVFCLASLAVAGYLAYSLREDHFRIEMREKDRLTDQCNVVSMNLGRQFDAINAALAGIVNDAPVWRRQKDGAKLAAQHLKALNAAMPGVLTFLVFDAGGTVQASDRPDLIGKNFVLREYFQAALKNPGPNTLYVRPPFTSSRGNYTMNFARMIPAGQGQFDGLVVAALDAEEFKVLLNSVLYRPDTKASLIHGSGVPFLMAPHSKYIDGLNLVQTGSFFTQHVNSGRETNVYSGPLTFDGDERLIALKTIQPKALSMDNPMVIAIDRPLKSIFRNWFRAAVNYSVIFALSVLLAGASLLLYQRRRSNPRPDPVQTRLGTGSEAALLLSE